MSATAMTPARVGRGDRRPHLTQSRRWTVTAHAGSFVLQAGLACRANAVDRRSTHPTPGTSRSDARGA